MTEPHGKIAQDKAKLVTFAIIAIAIVSMILAYRFATSEQEREKIVWQNRISVVLNGRSDVISDWIESHKQSIATLSTNVSVRLYFSNHSTDLGLDVQGQQAMLEYLRPLLNDRAVQNGFTAPDRDRTYSVNANTDAPRVAGLALINLEGKLLISTQAMPPVFEAVKAYIAAGANQDTMMIGPYIGETGKATVAYIAPVFGIDQDANGAALGFLVGVRLLEDEFFDLLVQPGEMAQSARNYLVYKQGEMIHFIQNNNIQDVDYQTAMDSGAVSIVAGYALENPGKMIEGLNFRGARVIASGINVKGTDWTLVRSIDVVEALGEGQRRKQNILTIAFLIIVVISILMALLWRHGISVRLQEAMEKQKALARKHENLSAFMSVVTNSQPTEISAVDENGNYTFVNLQAALSAGSQPENMIGKSPSAVFGRARVRVDELHCEEVLEQNSRQTKIHDVGTEKEPKTIKTDYLPLMIGDDNDIHEKGVLMVKEDITKLEQSHAKRELRLKSLVSTLTMIIASRDPFSAAHSERVVLVTNILSAELGVDETTAATAELAGAMMNLGKILVPRELLIKPTSLTADELSIIRSSMLKSADLVKDIEFEGPVAETLNQMQAHWDGSGNPSGLAGEAILLSARIVAVANAFVGMTSARAYRDGMAMQKAVQILMADADKIFDRRPVVALMNYLENKDGYAQWGYFSVPPETTD